MIKLDELVKYTGGKLDGNNDVVIKNVAKVEEAISGDLTFVSNEKYISYIESTNASAIFVKEGLKFKNPNSVNIVFVSDPYLAICMVMDEYFNPNIHPTGICKMSSINETSIVGDDVYIADFVSVGRNVKIGNGVKIYPNCSIGDNVSIGDNSVIYSNVSIYNKCEVGKSTIVHSGTVIGSDGFGHAPLPDGSYAKIPQIGNVIIGDYVEIGSNCSIDRATMGSTVIEDGVKLDNLIQVAHNVKIGENTVIASQTGISGSTELKENCIIGGQVGFVGHITIAKGTKIGAQSGIMKTIKEEGLSFLGSPIKPLKDEIKSQVLIRKLPELYKDIIDIKRIKDK